MLRLTARAELTLDAARERLAAPPGRHTVLTALAASVFAATSALALAAVVVLGPPQAWAGAQACCDSAADLGQLYSDASTDTRSAHKKASATSSKGRRSTSEPPLASNSAKRA